MKLVLALIICIAFTLTLFSSCANPVLAPTADELLDLGEKYLLDMNYEQALVHFLKVIEIEPMNPRGYIGAAEAYIGLGDTERAITVLQQGIGHTMDESIQAFLTELIRDTGMDAVSQPLSDKKKETEHKKETIIETIPLSMPGKEQFSLSDLEDWGYPWGISVYELRERGLIHEIEGMVSIDEWIERRREDAFRGDFLQSHQIENARTNFSINPNLDICVYWSNLLLGEVVLRFSEHSGATGPRGISIGMTLEEVVKLFRCDNSVVLDSMENNLLVPSNTGYLLYYSDLTDVENGLKHIGNLFIREGGGIFLDYAFYWSAKYNDGVSMSISFEDGTVESIRLQYNYGREALQ